MHPASSGAFGSGLLMSRAWLLLLFVLALGLCGPTLASGPGHRRSTGPVLPTPAQVVAAKRYASSRSGIVSFSVVDSRGKRYSLAGDHQFVSASVVKVMLLACFLNMKAIEHESLTSIDRSKLRVMITLSDNDAADWIYGQVGDARLYNLARRLGMRRFSVSGYWANAQLTTNDQALLMENLSRAVFPPYYAYARCSPRSPPGRAGASSRPRGLAAGRSCSRAAGEEQIAAG